MSEEIYEWALTEGRHEMHSLLTGDVLTESIFPMTIENVMDMADHVRVVTRKMAKVPRDATIIVYISGLTLLTQAVYVAWLNRTRLFGGSLDLWPGELIFAHYDFETKTYRAFSAMSGNVYPREWIPYHGADK